MSRDLGKNGATQVGSQVAVASLGDKCFVWLHMTSKHLGSYLQNVKSTLHYKCKLQVQSALEIALKVHLEVQSL